MYECLASTFRQVYLRSKIHVRLCISSRSDPALSVLERLIHDFPDIDAQILVEAEDDLLNDGTIKLGPNPKIRNMSRAYREASKVAADIVWIIDCNVWVDKYTLNHMVSRLEGNKFVHQLPLVVDTVGTTSSEETRRMLEHDATIRTTSSAEQDTVTLPDRERTAWSIGGGRLEELFLSSAHAKFYTAINTVSIAPCSVGKSTMFHRSHLDSLTSGQGIDYFSENICEDHLIGDLLWKQKTLAERQGQHLGKHALCFGELAIQPMSNMSLPEYWSRRLRWLRVRKFTVTLATFVEPGTEALLCSVYGAFAVTTLPFFNTFLYIPSTWATFVAIWLLSVTVWCTMDWKLYQFLQSASSVHVDDDTPVFARAPKGGKRRSFHEWLAAWLGREILALPIWLWAFYGGTQVEWRGKNFWVGMDMRVHEIDGRNLASDNTKEGIVLPPTMNGKHRRD